MKFVLKYMSDAEKEGWPESEDWSYDYPTGLYEVDDDGNPVRLVAVDGGEPEDQTFNRDWAWVEVELNKMAERVRKAEQIKYDALILLHAYETDNKPPSDVIKRLRKMRLSRI